MFKVKAILLGVLLAQSAMAGTDFGNGGGVYIRENQVKTLAEAGTILDQSSHVVIGEYPRLYIIPAETRDTLRLMIRSLPIPEFMGDKLYEKVMGRRDQFMKSTKIDEGEYARIVADYANVLKHANAPLDEGSFQLAAVSKGGKTYILPNFEKLSQRQKALILVHEYFMREFESKVSHAKLLPMVLEMDSQLFQLLEDRNKGKPHSVSGLLAAMFELHGRKFEPYESYMEVQYVAAALLSQITEQRDLRLSDLTVNIRYPRSLSDFDVEPSLVQEIPGIDSLTVKAFEGAKGQVMGDSSDMTREIFTELCEKRAENSGHLVNASDSSGVENDFFIHVSKITGDIFAYNCRNRSYHPGIIVDDAFRVNFDKLSPILYSDSGLARLGRN